MVMGWYLSNVLKEGRSLQLTLLTKNLLWCIWHVYRASKHLILKDGDISIRHKKTWRKYRNIYWAKKPNILPTSQGKPGVFWYENRKIWNIMLESNDLWKGIYIYNAKQFFLSSFINVKMECFIIKLFIIFCIWLELFLTKWFRCFWIIYWE